MDTKSNGTFKLNVGTGPSTEIPKRRTQKPPLNGGEVGMYVEVAQYTFIFKIFYRRRKSVRYGQMSGYSLLGALGRNFLL
jgi:hypothetical protein